MEQEDYHYLRSGLILHTNQQALIEESLAKLVRELPAQFVLLADITGQIVSTKGEYNKKNLVSLGSLVAGDLAASQEIARLTSQFQNYQLVLREGETSHIFICEASDNLALLVQISNEIPLGWARIAIRKVAETLNDITSNPPETNNSAMGKTTSMTLEDDFILDEENLASLENALDDLWLE